jgi:hypothetical protein
LHLLEALLMAQVLLPPLIQVLVLARRRTCSWFVVRGSWFNLN